MARSIKSDQRSRRRRNEKASSRPRTKDKRSFEDKSSSFRGKAADAIKRSENRESAVEKLLSGIGIPERSPFKPDDFQLEALNAIAEQDVLVTAPTGSGKTWVAREEIKRLLAEGRRAWYTTPLKALTNSKYAEFKAEFGEANVGILTGDRKENHSAPLIVGTTEIYRNQLFDAMREGANMEIDLVILDEAHYLSDDERGHVWEEAIILTPPRIRMLLLSATVGGADNFARWIGEVRGTDVRVIDRAGSRPVELRAGYLSSDLELFPLLNESGNFNPDLVQFEKRRQNHNNDGRSTRGRYGRRKR